MTCFNKKYYTQSDYEMLVTAFNNRTRQLNYFKLYTKYIHGNITFDEFHKELEENENKYVVPSGSEKTSDEVMFATLMSQDLMDVDSTEELMSVFEIDDKSMIKFMEL